MKKDGVYNLMSRAMLSAAFIFLAVVLTSGGLKQVSAQRSGDLAIEQAQRAVREKIIAQEGGNGQTVLFNRDAASEFISNTEVRVRGTGTFSRNGDTRNNGGRSRGFSYEAIVANRNRNRNSNSVSGIRYDWKGGWSGNGDSNYGRDGGYRGQSIYCASEDGRRHTCAVNTRGGVRLVNQKSDSACVQGQTWGFDNSGIWVDRGCRADFETSGNGGSGNGGANYEAGQGDYAGGNRPNGPVSYSGPIMNRHSDKGLDVTAQSNQDGANIQQWSYADQSNQNWDIVDLGNGEVAIISRHSGKALTIQGGRDNNGANIIQRTWNDNRQQRWRLEKISGDYYRIASSGNGMCLDVADQGKQDGAKIQLWGCADQANQQWRLRR